MDKMKILHYYGSKSEFIPNKIFCLGQNYANHIKEMKAEIPSTPVIFMKPSSAIITNGEPIILPSISNNIHHEVELVVAIGKNGKDIPVENALSYIAGYAVGLDMTLRDVQAAAKKNGLPWTVAKGFDTSAPISDILLPSMVANPHNCTLECRVNNELRQHGSTRDMIFSIDKIIAYLSTIFTLETGDLIFTGTPEGVGPVHTGDTIHAELVGLISITHPVSAN
jgi:acylpyruvate hydrolase